MSKVLVVDDERSIRSTFEIFLSKEGHEVFLAEDAFSAIKISQEQELDLVITDIIMPKVTGMDLLVSLRIQNPDVPIVIMTGEPTVDTAQDAVKSGASDYLIKPISKENLIKAARYSLEKKKLTDEKVKLEVENTKYRESLEILVDQRTKELKQAVNGTVEIIVKIMEHKDPYTSGHQIRVASLAMAIARELSLSEDEINRIYFASYLHDIGKMLVPSEILSKPGKLSNAEFEVIKDHVKNGSSLTEGIKLENSISDLILQHHERMDGSGYPNGIKGDQIQIGAKILAVADVIEAMVSHRPYRPGFAIEIALDEIKTKSGVLYDEEVSKIAVKLFESEKFDFSDVKNYLLI